MDYITSLFQNKSTRLCNAVLMGDHEEVKKVLLEGAEPNTCMPPDCNNIKCKNMKLLNVAVEQGNECVVTALLEGQASTENNTVDEGEAPLNRAVALRLYNIVELLLECGADVNTRNSDYGALPIHTAAQDDDVQMAMILHEGGSPLDAPDNFGQTPLHMAAMRGHKSMSEWLVREGVDASATRNDGHTAAEYAESHNHKELAEWLRYCTVNPVDSVVQLWKKELKWTMQKAVTEIGTFKKENHSLKSEKNKLELKILSLEKDKKILNYIECITTNKDHFHDKVLQAGNTYIAADG